MVMGTEELLRLTVAALMTRTGERQNVVAEALGLSQAQVSRKQAGRQHWSLEDVDGLAAHFGLHVLDLLAGPTHAVGVLHGSIPALRPFDVAAPPLAAQLPLPAVQLPAQPPHTATPQSPAPEAAVPAVACVLCGQPTSDELEGFPQHLSAEECAAAVAAATPTPLAPASVPQQLPAEASTLAPAPEAAKERPEGQPGAVPDDPAPAAPLPAAPLPAAPLPAEPAVQQVQPEPSPAAPAGPAPEPQAEPSAAPVEPAVTSAGPRAPRAYASGSLVDQITGRVHEALQECDGDLEAAQAALLKSAIPDVMTFFKASRVGGRYEHSEFPPTADVLRKRSQKGADEIWEGRPKWRNASVFKAAKAGAEFEVTALDMNAAYLSAFKAWLPIGQLREDTSGVHDRKKAGVHLITPAEWEHTDLPNPLGNRMEPGELWVSESTLRLLLDCARENLADAPTIHRSLVSGGTEVLLEKLRRALAEVRKTALAEGDELTVNYVKSMYSKLVSTLGESTANRDMRRPDWMHIMRAKAFANLWMKANKIHKAGLQVVEISGTDELHVIGDWRQVFAEGRDLNQVKEKNIYTLGGRR
ncbi:BetR domain-containing protein [Streptomyces sp. CG 926]|uniref:helix-turn-helix domain-containing protein n=1 Tax=Streptomyces sp. CG 926 TaxID=1882405 RepID=UPI000D6D1BAE|nr:helix-turn-helix domain-containing protein [Streptomyces sp. CG 926]PWK61825.1 BetR domain-containing protein [Streptomyces sp. CG 926]